MIQRNQFGVVIIFRKGKISAYSVFFVFFACVVKKKKKRCELITVIAFRYRDMTTDFPPYFTAVLTGSLALRRLICLLFNCCT